MDDCPHARWTTTCDDCGERLATGPANELNISYGPAPWPVPITDVHPGDEWTTDSDTVVIDDIEVRPTDENFPSGAVRLSGRIIRGHGASQHTRFWTFHPDHELQIVRRR